MSDHDIDKAARAFAEAAHALAELLLVKLETEAPELKAKAEQALGYGERMQLLLEIDPTNPRIVWQMLDDYDKPWSLMALPATMPKRH